MRLFPLSIISFLALAGMLLPCQAEDPQVDYLTQVKPILRNQCFACHGGLKQEGELRLDTVKLIVEGGYSGAILTPGKADESILIERVIASDPEERMPPEHEGEPLTPKNIELLRNWINQGARGPTEEEPESDATAHWAFQPITRPDVPVVENQKWVKNPIDAFLAQKHEQKMITPNEETDRVVLLRRLYLDLIGIPPTLEEIEAFQNDTSSEWYTRTVDRLLNDPRHGERWARHWMDVWRYSDWWGFGAQLRFSQKHIWHWRDWIVESLNEDLSYAEMIRLMISVDEQHPNDLDKLRASGFLARNWILFNRDQWMDETIEHFSKGILGLTMNCAKCHDHKYDPIGQEDYYRMRAFFEPYHVRMDMLPGETNLKADGLPRAYDGWIDKPTYLYIRGQESKPDKSKVMQPGLPEVFAFKELDIQPVSLPIEAWQPGQRTWVQKAHQDRINRNLERAEKKLSQAKAKIDQSKEPEKAKLLEAELKVADAEMQLATAEQLSYAKRLEAMVAQKDNASDQFKEKSLIAIQAEREARVAKEHHALCVAQLELLNAGDDKKKKVAAEKKQKTARKTLETAKSKIKEEIKPTDEFTPISGAEWTPTRFLESRTDDPYVEFPSQSTGRRSALADWIIDSRNPLTARVAANQIWMRHMNAPLVPTVFDFGRNGVAPIHPELLDWLASELIDSGWSMKHLHRVIVNSSAYRMKTSISGAENNIAKDQDNHYWWRRTPVRLESQVVRDSILSHTGTLDLTMGGPPVPSKEQGKSKRRSLYFFHSNNERNLFLTTFDEAMVKECYQRDQSIVPQQALALTNSKLIFDSSVQIAKRLSEEAEEDSVFVRKAFLVLLGFNPNNQEVAASTQALEAWRQLPEGSPESARSNLVRTILNHHDFVTLR